MYLMNVTHLIHFMHILRFMAGLPGVMALFLMMSFAVWGEEAAKSSAAASAKRITNPIHLDGRLDEEAWNDAQVLELVQQSPRPGEATPYKTQVKDTGQGFSLKRCPLFWL